MWGILLKTIFETNEKFRIKYIFLKHPFKILIKIYLINNTIIFIFIYKFFFFFEFLILNVFAKNIYKICKLSL